MAKISKSQLKAAVSAIMQRDRSERPPGRMPQRAALSKLRRAHLERLQSELAKAGLDFGRLEKLYAEYKKEAGKLFDKLTPPDDSKPVKPTKSDQAWIDNKKRVYELIAGRPLVTFPIVLDAPTAIYSIPSGALVDSHIGSWNSWARWNHRDTEYEPEELRQAFLKFLFAWRNNSPNPVVIKNASADLSIRGFCFVQANPFLYFSSYAGLLLNVYHRAYTGATSFSGDDRTVLNIGAYTGGYLSGGAVDLDGREIDRLDHVRCQDIVVPGGLIAYFEVGVQARYLIGSGDPTGGGDGDVQCIFTGSGGRIACPSLVLELSLVVQS
jgi:hypothetical protein